MSDKTNRDNLISGFLDDQLSPTERAEAEELMRDDPSLIRVKDQLDQQSQQLAGLPRFQLENGFADLLMADGRFEDAFQKMASVPIAQPLAWNRSHRFRAAAAAIGSLAALVLITLFLPTISQSPVVETAVKLGEFESNQKSAPEFDFSNDESAEDVENAIDDETNDSYGLELSRQRKSSGNFKSDSMRPLVDSKLDNDSKDSRLEFSDRAKSESAEQTIDSVTSMPIERRIANKSIYPKRLPPISESTERPVVQLLEESRKEIARFQKAQPKRGRDNLSEQQMELGDFGTEPEAPSQTMRQQVVGSSLGLDAVQPNKESFDDAIDQVVEIELPDAGENWITDFKRALGKNLIAIDDTDKFDIQLGFGRASRGSGGGMGGGGGGRFATNQVPKLESLKRGYQQSLALLVRATPEQMKKLVDDFGDQAKIGTYEIPRFNSLQVDNLKTLETLKSGRGGGSDVAMQEKIQNELLKRADTKKTVRKKALSHRGLAQLLQKNVWESKVTSENQPASKEEENRFFAGRPLDKTISQNYLLFVRGGIPTGVQDASESVPAADTRSAAPSKK